MKTLIRLLLRTCGICHGMGTTEVPGSGDTKPCHACKGKGFL